MTHPAADLLRAIADGKQMETLAHGEWTKSAACVALGWISSLQHERVRIARPMVTRTVTYPEPLRVKPEKGARYFVPDHGEVEPCKVLWANDEIDNRILNAGMAFATEADAAEAHRALFGGGV